MSEAIFGDVIGQLGALIAPDGIDQDVQPPPPRRHIVHHPPRLCRGERIKGEGFDIGAGFADFRGTRRRLLFIVAGHRDAVKGAIERLRAAGIVVSLFLDPDQRQIDLAKQLGAEAVELHTGAYAEAGAGQRRAAELTKLTTAGAHVRALGLTLHAGHGLTYRNIGPVARIEGLCEFNIGHSIVARAVLVGMRQATREMIELIEKYAPREA